MMTEWFKFSLRKGRVAWLPGLADNDSEPKRGLVLGVMVIEA
jgi:hypothetical protein